MLRELQILINPEVAYLRPIGAMLLQHSPPTHASYSMSAYFELLMQAYEHILLRLPLQDTHDMMWILMI